MITYPLNNVQYTAEDAELFHATRTSGVFAGTDFQITADGASSIVTVGEGIGWIRNTRFSGKVVANKTTETVDLGVADSVYPRIDAVVIQFDANQNQTNIVVKQGTAASSPQPPAVVRTETLYELHLCHILRAAGSAAVSSADITDLRTNSDYCGLMASDITDLPINNILTKADVGVAGGVAALNSSGKVPSSQLPPMDFLPTSQKGTAGGVASLGNDGKVPASQLPTQNVDLSGYLQKQGGTMTGDLVAAAASSFTSAMVRNVVTVSDESSVASVVAPTGTLICVEES